MSRAAAYDLAAYRLRWAASVPTFADETRWRIVAASCRAKAEWCRHHGLLELALERGWDPEVLEAVANVARQGRYTPGLHHGTPPV